MASVRRSQCEQQTLSLFATGALQQSWNVQHKESMDALRMTNALVGAIHEDAARFVQQKEELKREARRLQQLASDARAICRVAGTMDQTRSMTIDLVSDACEGSRGISQASASSEPQVIDIMMHDLSTSPPSHIQTRDLEHHWKPTVGGSHPSSRTFESLLVDVLPSLQRGESAYRQHSPHPKYPADVAVAPRAAVMRDAMPDALGQKDRVLKEVEEDDLVVLLLKRQLQRRELELKKLMET